MTFPADEGVEPVVARPRPWRPTTASLSAPLWLVRALAVLQLGTSLGLRVVMEGVETNRQLHHVRRLGFTAAQGFVFAQPMSADLVLPWFARPEVQSGRHWQVRLAPAT